MSKDRIYTMSFSKVYPLYIAKVEKKGRGKREVDAIIQWLLGYNKKQLDDHIQKNSNMEDFILESPKLNPYRKLIKGKICGISVEEIEDDIIREIRYLDKLIDELARGKSIEKILRKPSN